MLGHWGQPLTSGPAPGCKKAAGYVAPHTSWLNRSGKTKTRLLKVPFCWAFSCCSFLYEDASPVWMAGSTCHYALDGYE